MRASSDSWSSFQVRAEWPARLITARREPTSAGLHAAPWVAEYVESELHAQLQAAQEGRAVGDSLSPLVSALMLTECISWLWTRARGTHLRAVP